jgi:hypothetical protein
MREAAQMSAVRGWYRCLALAVLVALILTPSCSSVCQARTCPISQPANSDSSCHHQQRTGMCSEDSLRMTAADGSCGLHELLIALPAAKSSLEPIVTPASSTNSSLFFAAVSTYAKVLSDSSFPRDIGPERRSGRSAARQFSFDTLIFLRI